METLYLKALGLGIAGFDPSGALIAIALLAAGASRRAVVLFCLVYLTGAIALLTLASRILSTRMPGTGWRALDDHPGTRAGAELVIGVALLAFAGWRLLRPGAPKPTTRRPLPVSTPAAIGLGALLAVGVVGDPALLAFTVVAGTADTRSTVILAQAIAVLASKALVVVVMAAVAFGLEGRLTGRITAWWKTAAPVMGRIVPLVLIAMALVLVVNATWWLRTGAFLL